MTMLNSIEQLMALDPTVRQLGKWGVPQPSNHVSVVSTAATLLFTLPTTGSATAWLLGFTIFNRNAAAVSIFFANSAGTQRTTRYGLYISGYGEVEWITPVHFDVDIYVVSSAAAAAPSEVQIAPFVIVIP